MSARAPLPQSGLPLDPGPVLVFAAHPGDELLAAGGTLALHAAQGDRVHVIVAYDGAGREARSARAREELVERRRDECLAGGAHLGLAEYEFWEYPEGREPTPDELFFAARLLAGRVRELAPRTLYAPWIGEHALDQHMLARATRLALEMAEFSTRAWGCEVWTPLLPTRIVDISDVWERKQSALREHRSQLPRRDLAHVALGLCAQRSAWLPSGARYAEAFAPLSEESRSRTHSSRPGHAA